MWTETVKFRNCSFVIHRHNLDTSQHHTICVCVCVCVPRNIHILPIKKKKKTHIICYVKHIKKWKEFIWNLLNFPYWFDFIYVCHSVSVIYFIMYITFYMHFSFFFFYPKWWQTIQETSVFLHLSTYICMYIGITINFFVWNELSINCFVYFRLHERILLARASFIYTK